MFATPFLVNNWHSNHYGSHKILSGRIYQCCWRFWWAVLVTFSTSSAGCGWEAAAWLSWEAAGIFISLPPSLPPSLPFSCLYPSIHTLAAPTAAVSPIFFFAATLLTALKDPCSLNPLWYADHLRLTSVSSRYWFNSRITNSVLQRINLV